MRKIKFILGLSIMFMFAFVFTVGLKANGEVVKVEVTIQASVDGANPEVGLVKEQKNYGDTFILDTASIVDNFAFWVVNGVVKEDLAVDHTFTATNNFNALAVFYTDQVAVYVDHNGRLIGTDYNADPVAPANPDKIGYEFTEWKEVYNKDGAVVYRATYENTHDPVKVNEDDAVIYNSIFRVEDGTGKWVKNGEVVSYNANYAFSALLDETTIENVALDQDEVAKSLVTLEVLEGYRELHTTYLGQVELLDGHTLVEYGLEVNGVLRNDGLVIHDETNEFLVSTLSNWDTVRAYAIYHDGSEYVTIFDRDLVVEPANTLMIYDAFGGGGNAGAPYTHDYVVLYNAGDDSIDLAGYSLQYAAVTSENKFNNILALEGIIESQGFYLISLAAGSGNGVPIPFVANITGNLNLAGAGFQLALVEGLEGITTIDETVVDFLGVGPTAHKYEGNPTPASSNSNSVKRNAFVDTNNNNQDFTVVEANLSYLNGHVALRELYTVTFDTDGSDPIPSQTVLEGNLVVKPNSPTKEGFTFEGWLLNDEEFDFSTIITSDITLIADWKKIEEGAPQTFEEGFDGLETLGGSTSYVNAEYVGNYGLTWTFTHAQGTLQAGHYIDGQGIILRRGSDSSSIEVTLPNGITTFTFDYRKAYTGGTARDYSVSITNNGQTTTVELPSFGSGTGADATTHTYNYVGVPLTGEVKIKIFAVTSGNAQATFDNFKWTEGAPLSDLDKVTADKDALIIGYASGDLVSEVKVDLTLPTVGGNGSTITWASSNAEVITVGGVVTRQNADTVVTLTATITSGEESDTKDFEVTVAALGKENLRDALANLEIGYTGTDNEDSVTANLTLTDEQNGTTVAWSSSNTSVIANDGTVVRPDVNTQVTLTATLTINELEDTKEFVVTVIADGVEPEEPETQEFKFIVPSGTTIGNNTTNNDFTNSFASVPNGMTIYGNKVALNKAGQFRLYQTTDSYLRIQYTQGTIVSIQIKFGTTVAQTAVGTAIGTGNNPITNPILQWTPTSGSTSEVININNDVVYIDNTHTSNTQIYIVEIIVNYLPN